MSNRPLVLLAHGSRRPGPSCLLSRTAERVRTILPEVEVRTLTVAARQMVEIAKADGIDEDTILMAVLDAGAEEVLEGPESFEVISDSSDLIAVRNAVTEAGMEYDSAESQFLAGTKVEVDLDGARKVMRLIDALEDLDDVQNVFTSVDISPEVAAQLDDE